MALTKTNILVGFRRTRIWLLNIKAMNAKIGLSKGFMLLSATKVALEKA